MNGCGTLVEWYWGKVKVKVKVKFTLQQAVRTQKGRRCIALFLFTFGARCVEWSTPRPGRFTLWQEIHFPLYRRLGGHQGRSGLARKISPATGIRSQYHSARNRNSSGRFLSRWHFSATIPTWIGLGLNPGLRSDWPELTAGIVA